MRNIGSGIVLLACALLACADADAPVGVAPVAGAAGAVPASAVAAAATCTHRWASAVTGYWTDISMWSGGTVPDSNAVVCIDVPGTYTVNVMPPMPNVRRVVLGDGVSAITMDVFTLAPTPLSQTLRTDDLVVTGGARLTGNAAWMDVADSLVIEGTVASALTIDAGYIVNAASGTIDIAGDTRWQLTGFNPVLDTQGTVRFTSGAGLYVYAGPSITATVRVTGGTVSGDGTLWVSLSSIVPYGFRFDWTGGTMEPNSADTTRAIVSVAGPRLTIGAATAGRIDVHHYLEAAAVGGVVPAGVTVRMLGSPYAPSAPMELGLPSVFPLWNQGRLEISDPAQVASVEGALVNDGTVVLGPGRVDLSLDSLANRGTLFLRDSVRFDRQGSVLRNAGAISGSRSLVAVGGASFVAAAGSMTPRLGLEGGGRLTGVGDVGAITSVGGIVSPGGNASGTLTAPSITLDAASRVIVQVGGTGAGEHDLLVSRGGIVLGGALEARTERPFVPGTCGQVVPLILHARSATPVGAFAQLVGFQPAPTRAWRLHQAAGAIQLAGYDPTRAIDARPHTLALAEGGAGGAVDVCLGGAAPTADVVLTIAPRLGQVTRSPAMLSFPVASWALPQRLTVTAVNDALGEGPHADTVRLTAGSPDPAYHLAKHDLPVTIADDDPGADLAVTLVAADTANAVVGRNFDARFRVTNHGPTASTGSTFTIAPMPGFDYSHGGAGATCAQSAGVLTCTIGALAPGAHIEFSPVFTGRVAGTHAHTVRIAGAGYDHVAANDSFSWVVTVR